MFELLFTSFPVIIKYYILRRRGEEMTVYNMKTAVFLWLALAFALFLSIFYYHPKSYTGIVPFRTVSVVAQTSGPVTHVLVENGQHVAKGDILFKIENNIGYNEFAKVLFFIKNRIVINFYSNCAPVKIIYICTNGIPQLIKL